MSMHHGHSHHHHHHGDHTHDDGAEFPQDSKPRGWLRRNSRYLVAAIIVGGAVLSACLVIVQPGEAVVVTRFGNPARVDGMPGIAWRAPLPIESTINVDLRLRTTSSGLHDVATHDGLRVLVQAYVAWQVPNDPDHIRQFLRAVRNQPDDAAVQLQSFVGSALEIAASGFDLSSLVNTDPKKVQLDAFETKLRERLEQQVLSVYGVAIKQVGIERLTLPPETLDATVERMSAERLTVAAQREAEGNRAAAEIRSNAERDSRVTVAQAEAEAAAIDAKARADAAEIYGTAYRSDPDLYTLVRSLDTLDAVIGSNTRLILRTDAAPFRAFVEGPASITGTPTPAPKVK
jgi:modulator of FtsH protease HflC